MKPQPTDDLSTTPLSGERPGEFSHYYLNLLAILGQERGAEAISELARQAVSNRDRHIAQFERRIEELHEFYRAQPRNGAGWAERDANPLLDGWSARDLPFLRAAHDGLLIALFHYGNHRQAFTTWR